MDREAIHRQTASIRLIEMKNIMKNAVAVKELATKWNTTTSVICGMLVLKKDGFNDADDEIRYALQCGVDTITLENAILQSISEKTLLPIKMLYVEKGGGTE